MIRAAGILACAAVLSASGELGPDGPMARGGGGGPPVCADVACAVQVESLLVAAQRAARDWWRHDFEHLVAQSGGILLSLPGSAPSAPLQPAQAALLLHGFADGAEEIEVEVVVARNVDRERAYVEARRTFTARGGTTRRTHTIYFGLRLDGVSYRLAEIRVVP